MVRVLKMRKALSHRRKLRVVKVNERSCVYGIALYKFVKEIEPDGSEVY